MIKDSIYLVAKGFYEKGHEICASKMAKYNGEYYELTFKGELYKILVTHIAKILEFISIAKEKRLPLIRKVLKNFLSIINQPLNEKVYLDANIPHDSCLLEITVNITDGWGVSVDVGAMCEVYDAIETGPNPRWIAKTLAQELSALAISNPLGILKQ